MAIRSGDTALAIHITWIVVAAELLRRILLWVLARYDVVARLTKWFVNITYVKYVIGRLSKLIDEQ